MFEIFEQTGIQFLQLNSLYQLLAMTIGGAPELAEAEPSSPCRASSTIGCRAGRFASSASPPRRSATTRGAMTGRSRYSPGVLGDSSGHLP